MNEKHELPQYPEPIWRENLNFPSFSTLRQDKTADVAIVGAGITGITTAYLLVKAGLNVVLIDSDNILNGTTGHTTAKVTAQHGLIYDELISHFGEEKAKLYYESNRDAIDFIKQTVKEKKIDCELKNEDAYLYATSEQSDKKINNEYKAYQKLGITGEIIESIPFNIKIKSALVMRNQAQFHPLRYLVALVDEIKSLGGQIYENTTATDIEEGPNPKVITDKGFTITCDNLISCSHFPFVDGRGIYFARLYAERSYILAVKSEKAYPGGMYVSVDQPSRSLRSTTLNGEELILAIGENHKTGQGINTMKHYEALKDWSMSILDPKAFPYRWSTQDLETLDKIPYIGPISSKHANIFVATGYKKWGMTSSTVAAHLLTDYITKKPNKYKEVYTPSRFQADPDLKNLTIQNTDVAGHLIAGKVGLAHTILEELANDEGAVVKIRGRRTGAYRDTVGKLHLVDTTCTHMGCECEWNAGDRSWDCPCHGSRYSVDGEVIEGPANKPLSKVNND